MAIENPLRLKIKYKMAYPCQNCTCQHGCFHETNAIEMACSCVKVLHVNKVVWTKTMPLTCHVPMSKCYMSIKLFSWKPAINMACVHVKTLHVNKAVFMKTCHYITYHVPCQNFTCKRCCFHENMRLKWPVPLSKFCMSTRLFSWKHNVKMACSHVKIYHVNKDVFMKSMPLKWPVPPSKCYMSTTLFSWNMPLKHMPLKWPVPLSKFYMSTEMWKNVLIVVSWRDSWRG